MNRRRRMKARPVRGEATATRRIAAVLAFVAATSGLPEWTAARAASGQAARPMPIMMTVACVEAGEAGAFHLIRAAEPEAIADRLPPQPDPSTALGVHRIRLIGTLEEFGRRAPRRPQGLGKGTAHRGRVGAPPEPRLDFPPVGRLRVTACFRLGDQFPDRIQERVTFSLRNPASGPRARTPRANGAGRGEDGGWERLGRG